MVACSTNKGLPRTCSVFYDSLYRNLARVLLVQSVGRIIANPRVVCSIPAWPHTLVEIDHYYYVYSPPCCQLHASVWLTCQGIKVWLGQLTSA